MTNSSQPSNEFIRDKVIAYLFWFFLPALGAHRFWWGKWKTALLMLAMNIGGWAAIFFGIIGTALGAGMNLQSIMLAGGGAAIAGVISMALAGIWWVLDVVFILLWGPRK